MIYRRTTLESRPTSSRSKNRLGRALACITALVSTALVITPASAETPAPAAPPAVVQPDAGIPAPPTINPDGSPVSEAPARTDLSTFDPARAVPVEAETTSTKRVYRNADGSYTAQLSSSAERFQDAKGTWVDIDLTLAPVDDGTLRPRAADPGVRLASKTDAGVALAAIDTVAGTLELHHPDASATPAVVDKATATFEGALDGRDLSLRGTVSGFEESVTLHSAADPSTYVEQITMPRGMTARDGAAGVEFIGPSDEVVATYGSGMAYDASFPGPGPGAPVPASVHLVTDASSKNTVSIEVGVDPKWLASADRKFPATIDPVMYVFTNPGSGNLDSTVYGAAPTTSYASSPYLQLGSADGVNVLRSLLSFDVASIVTPGSDILVFGSRLWVYDIGQGTSCTPTAVKLYGLGSPFTASTTWNTQPSLDANGVVSTLSWKDGGSGSACYTASSHMMDTTALAQRWLNGTETNNGIELRASAESDPLSYKILTAGEYGSGTAPNLYIAYDRLPKAPTGATATANANGTVGVGWTASVPNGGSAIDSYAINAYYADSGFIYANAQAFVCSTCTTATISGLTRNRAYVFAVFAHNAMGYSDGAVTPNVSTVADSLVRAGDAPYFSYDTYSLSDRLGAKVNLGTGNLVVSTNDIAIPVVGGSRVLGRTYNSLALAPASTDPASPLFGPGWRFSEAPDRRLAINPDLSVTYLSGSGNASTFSASTFTAPPGIDATLVRNNDATYKLTFHVSGEVVNFRYDGAMTSDVDRNGNAITFTYPGGGGYEASIAGNAGAAPANTVNITYGGPGGKVSTIAQTADSTTRTVSYDYDAGGYLFHVIDAGGTTTFNYDAVTHDLTKITGPAPISQVTQFAYDSAHRVSSVTRVIPGGNSVTGYDFTNPAQPKRTDADGHPPTTFTVDGSGRVTATLDAKGKTTQTAFSPDAKVGTFTNSSSGQTINTWDQNNGESLSQSESPTGAKVKASYNSTGLPYLPDSVTDSMGNASLFKYNGSGNLQSSANPLTNTATIKLNTDGTVDLSTDPMNVTNPDPALQDRTKATQYGYNGLHQLTSTTPPAGNSLAGRSFSYDGFGRLKTVTSARGVITTYGYNTLDRLLSETHSDASPTISYDYDADGNTFHRTDGSGITTFVSDAANRLTSKAIPSGPTLTYAYDPVGNLASLGGDGRGTTTYQYDTLNLLEQMTESSARIDVFAYNADHQRTDTWNAATYTGGGGVRYDGSGNVVPPSGFAGHIHSTLDSANQLTRIKNTRASSDADANRVADVSYGYDLPSPNPCPTPPPSIVHTGLRQTSTDNVSVPAKVTTYCYDGGGHLTKAITTGGPTYTWAYDADGNRTSGPEGSYPPYNTANQLTGPGTVTYDAEGNLTVSTALAVTYNGTDQTSSVIAGGPAVAIVYAGSGQSERTAVGGTVQRNGILGVQAETTGGATTYYERDNQGTLVSERTPSGDFYFAFDGLGSVVGLTDPAGVQRAAYSYDPFGAQATSNPLGGSLPPNPWRYAGGYLDPTGLYHLGARYYVPESGTWTQQDNAVSLGNPASANRYVYVGASPTNYVDPSGYGACLLLIHNSKGCLGGSVDDNGKNITRFIEGVGCASAFATGVAGTVLTGGLAAPATGFAAGCLFSIAGGEATIRVDEKGNHH